jgi:hypothetical protein
MLIGGIRGCGEMLAEVSSIRHAGAATTDGPRRLHRSGSHLHYQLHESGQRGSRCQVDEGGRSDEIASTRSKAMFEAGVRDHRPGLVVPSSGETLAATLDCPADTELLGTADSDEA